MYDSGSKNIIKPCPTEVPFLRNEGCTAEPRREERVEEVLESIASITIETEEISETIRQKIRGYAPKEPQKCVTEGDDGSYNVLKAMKGLRNQLADIRRTLIDTLEVL